MSPRGGAPDGPSARGPAISVAVLLWLLLLVLFALLRVGIVWRAPVGGAELAHLSGAWQASIGVEDDRFVPTLFQAVTALTLRGTDSEVPARVLAFAATMTVPLALYLLRRPLGEAGALFALLLLTFDPTGIVLGATASAIAWDGAISLWFLVALIAFRPPPWVWLPLGFLVATAGPLPLPFVAAATALAAVRGRWSLGPALAWGGAGVALGVLLTSVQFGLGSDGVRVAPFELFAAAFEEPWSTATAGELAALYGLPILIGGAAALASLGMRLRAAAEPPPAPAEALTGAAAIIAALWFLLALTTHSAIPLAAATLAFSLILGPALARFASLLLGARWQAARYLLPLALVLAAIGAFVLSDWARVDRVGGTIERTLVAAPLTLAVAALALLALRRSTAALTAVPALAGGAVLLVAGAMGVALSAAEEPLPSPASAEQGRELRRLALNATAEGGLVVVHERYREAITWPFRDSGTIVLASRVPPDAAFLVWPPDLTAPRGFVPVEGQWFLERRFHAPAGFLEYVRWLGDRNSLETGLEGVAVYTRTE